MADFCTGCALGHSPKLTRFLLYPTGPRTQVVHVVLVPLGGFPANLFDQVCFPLLDRVGQYYFWPYLLNRFVLPFVITNQRDFRIVQKSTPCVSGAVVQ